MTLIERGGASQRLRARLAEIPLDDVATSIISFDEQTGGWMALAASSQTTEGQIAAYTRLKAHIRTHCKFAVLDFDLQAGAVYVQLKRAKVRIGAMDLKIAAIALPNDAVLLTRNFSDF